MKVTLVFLLLFFIACHAYAQRSKSIGLFVEGHSALNSSYTQANGLGLIYKQMRKKNRAIRLQAGFLSKQHISSPTSYHINQDTFWENRLVRKDLSFYLGAGAEMQRQFYKAIYLFASADARLGYGYGNYQQRTTQSVFGSSAVSIQKIEDRSLPDFYSKDYFLDVLPSIGAKIVLRKIELALESGLNVRHAIFQQHTTVHNQIFDFDISGMRHRFSISYALR